MLTNVCAHQARLKRSQHKLTKATSNLATILTSAISLPATPSGRTHPARTASGLQPETPDFRIAATHGDAAAAALSRLGVHTRSELLEDDDVSSMSVLLKELTGRDFTMVCGRLVEVKAVARPVPVWDIAF